MRDDLRGLRHLLHGLAQLADDLPLVRHAEFDEVDRIAHEQAGVVEGVVELVGDPRGELAERGELAGLDELLLFVAQLLLAPLHFGRGLPQVTHDVDHRLPAVLQTQVGPGEPAAILLVVGENMEHRLALVAEAPVDLIKVAHDVEHGAALLVPLAQAPLQRLHVRAESILGYGLRHRAQTLHALAFRVLPQALQLLFEGDHLQLAAHHDLLELLQVQDLLLQLRLGLLEVAHYLLVGPHVAQDADGADHLAVGVGRAEALRVVGMTSPRALRGLSRALRVTPRSTTSRRAAVNSRVSSGLMKRESDCSSTSSWRKPRSWETASLACRILPSRSETKTGSGALAMMMSASSDPCHLAPLPSPLTRSGCVTTSGRLAISDPPQGNR